MRLRTFSEYRCLLALDPDEWPGEWEQLTDEFSFLAANRIKCFEYEAETLVTAIGPGSTNVDDVTAFLDRVLSRGMSLPKGGVCFLDQLGQVFKTNWELSETCDWAYVLRRLKREHGFQQCFGATGAIIEFQHVENGFRLQHLDYEFPGGTEGSRAELQGVVLKDEERFRAGVRGILDYVDLFARSANQRGDSRLAAILGTRDDARE